MATSKIFQPSTLLQALTPYTHELNYSGTPVLTIAPPAVGFNAPQMRHG